MAHKLGSLADERGMTLIELMAVIIIIGILTAIALMSYGFSTDKTRETSCKANLRTIRTAIEVYKSQNGTYPNSLNQLVPDFIRDHNDLICPATGQNYNSSYDKDTGEISCPECEP